MPTILGTANGLYFILSGYFNLEKEFKNVTDIKKFYKNKIIYILLPFLGFNLFWVVWDYIHEFGGIDAVGLLNTFFRAVVDTSAKGHMWFMYLLFGMLLSTPFLSKTLHSMNEKELKMLWRIAIWFNIIAFYVCGNFGIDFNVSAWLLDGWLIYYVSGYYFRHVIVKESSIKWISLCAFGYLVTCFGVNSLLPVFPQFLGGTDIQPMFTIFCLGFLFIWNRYVVINNETVGKAISFVGSHIYLVYLFHIRGMEYAVRKLHVVNTGLVSWLIVIFGTFAFSFVASVIVDLPMKPVQKFIDKIWTVK